MYEIMPLTRRNTISRRGYNPFSIFDEIEKNFFGNPQVPAFKTDIKDNGDSYELEAELPGFNKEDIDIEVKDDILTISAERSSESEEKDEDGNYIRRERSYGSFTRGFDVSDVNIDSIEVAYNNGILEVKMPKKSADEPKAKKLTIA